MTDDVLRQVSRLAYLWAWPMVNMHNRRVAFEQVPTNGLIGGVMPAAPLNNITMLLDYAPAEQRFVATPNQDVVYGFGIMALDREPVVVQVPDFDGRFWVYQIGDQRTDGFGELGQMYGSAPGFYLLAGPGWDGDAPDGIEEVFRSPTDIGYVIPRIFMDDTAQDRAAVAPYVSRVAAYPLSEFTGEMRSTDWSVLPSFPAPANEGGGEVSWVSPGDFFGVLPQVLREVAPMAGEESMYELVLSVVSAAESDPAVRQTLDEVAIEAERELITPLFDYSNEGVEVGHGWGTLVNAARFGTDYVTRTSCAKANIFANRPEESAYLFTDVDASGVRLTGDRSYTVTFAPGETPPVHGFWSLTLYDRHHFFAPNELDRFSLGTKNQDLHTNDDGSLTIVVQHRSPGSAHESNWLPAPADEFSLLLRAYWPEQTVLDGTWAPPPVLSAR